MKLSQPFFRLPVRFDLARLQAELAALPESAWAKHPNDIPGNSSIRLISVEGGENDDVDGVMLPTPHLAACPYMRQVLASFGVVWSRSRLLRLAPGASVPQHADINYHWFYRVRLHIPIVTDPRVSFHCDGEQVHMAAGEAWVFDNWRLHRVENPVDAARIHLVADTSGSATFWQLVQQGAATHTIVHEHRHDPAAPPGVLLTERVRLRPVMAPAEVDLLVLDLLGDLGAAPEAPADAVPLYTAMLDALRRDWRQLYQLFGENAAGWPEYLKLRDSVRAASREQGAGLYLRSNRVSAHNVLEARVLRALLSLPDAHGAPAAVRAGAHPEPRRPQRPVIVISAPRSGSTLLFETLAASDQVCTLGGEAPWLIENQPELRVGASGVDSNRLTAGHFTDELGTRIVSQLLGRLVDRQGAALPPDTPLRLVEKTPKNALRIPFFERLFPDALYVFLWRDPEPSLSSIIEAWRSGKWRTYNGLPGFDGPWSLLLPPGWQRYNGAPVPQIAAFQWECANRLALDDLAQLPPQRWTSVRYADLVADAPGAISRLCAFADLRLDAALAARLAAPLPLSRFTHTPPAADKWLRNEAEIRPLLPQVEATWVRLRALRP